MSDTKSNNLDTNNIIDIKKSKYNGLLGDETNVISGFYIRYIDDYKYIIFKTNNIKKLCVMFHNDQYLGYVFIIDYNEDHSKTRDPRLLNGVLSLSTSNINNINTRLGLNNLVNYYNKHYNNGLDNNISIYYYNDDETDCYMHKIYKFINKYIDIHYNILISIIFNEPGCNYFNKLKHNMKLWLILFRKLSNNILINDIIKNIIISYIIDDTLPNMRILFNITPSSSSSSSLSLSNNSDVDVSKDDKSEDDKSEDDESEDDESEDDGSEGDNCMTMIVENYYYKNDDCKNDDCENDYWNDDDCNDDNWVDY